jgi:addiction module HigA family antidote
LRRPTHPGAILREDILPALGISQSALAAYLGVSRLTVSEILLEKRLISARWHYGFQRQLEDLLKAGYKCNLLWIYGM